MKERVANDIPRQKPADDSSTDSESDQGFFGKILSVFLGMGDPEREKRRQLKVLGKTFTKDRYKFYKPRGSEILGAFGKFYYDLYRISYGVQTLIQPSETEGALKSVVIQSAMNEEQLALQDRLDEKTLRERSRGKETKELAEEIKQDIIAFFGTFDGTLIKQINTTYNNLRSFVAFCNYDFYFTLRMFDSAISEGKFSYKPKFEPISAEYAIENVKDFIEAAISLPRDVDWNRVFDAVMTYRGVDPVNREDWRKTVKALNGVMESGVLVRMVQHATQAPYWKPTAIRYDGRIVQTYLNEIRSSTEEVLQRISGERKSSKIEQLVMNVFGTTVVTRARNYTEKANIVFNKKQADGYLHTGGFNYLKAYLLDYFKKDVRMIVQDSLIVRGKWTTNIQSQQLSDAYHAVLSVSQDAVGFDDSLADEGDLGPRIRKAMGRVVDRDPGSGKALREVLDEVNGQALTMITEGAQNLIIIGKILKLLIEDVDRKDHEFIINWKELDSLLEEGVTMKKKMSDMYRQIYYLVQLLQVYAKAKG